MTEKNTGLLTSDRKDRALMGLSLIGLIICAVILSSEKAYLVLFGANTTSSDAPVIGEISFVRNDIRLRSADSLSWNNAKAQQGIRSGDSVFTGEGSRSQVVMSDGGQVNLDQNSMVKFTTIDKVELPNLALGNFRVSVNGKMKLAIDGQITEIEGNGSEVQIVLKDNKKPTVRLLKGTAKLKTKGTAAAVTLVKEKPHFMRPVKPAAPIRVFVAEVQKPEIPTETPAPVEIPQSVIPEKPSPTLAYTHELYDVFEAKGKVLVRRTHPRPILQFAAPVAWQFKGNVQKVYGQLSGSPQFDSIPSSFTAEAGSNLAIFPRTFLGANFYRLSKDGTSWSEVQSFTVISKPSDVAPPKIRVASNRLNILQETVELSGVIESQVKRFVLEASTSPDFPTDDTRVEWMTKSGFQFYISEPKVLYLRTRSVDEDRKLSAVSETVRVEIRKPELAENPRLAKAQFDMTQGEEMSFQWGPGARAKAYQITVLDGKGQVAARVKSDKLSYLFKPEKPGQYKLNISAIDAFGRPGKGVSQARIAVAGKAPERIPANSATPMLSQKLPEVPDYLNKNYPSSKLSLEGAAFTMTSVDQAGANRPIALTSGLRWMKWMDSQGIELSLKTKVANGNATAGQVSPLQFEGRYRYRWLKGFNPFSKFAQTEISLIAGYEAYRNPGSLMFSPGYNLFKGGFGLAFPLFEKWDTGGEMLLGQGADASSKYEISGNLNYYIDPRWSFGAGYRIHIFTAGSAATASPVGLPYREGFGEGFSVLRWHY